MGKNIFDTKTKFLTKNRFPISRPEAAKGRKKEGHVGDAKEKSYVDGSRINYTRKCNLAYLGFEIILLLEDVRLPT